MKPLDTTDRKLVFALQAGLPLTEDPWATVADNTGIDVDTVLERVARMQETGVIRRVGAVPNHYKLGMTANGMSVWNVDGRQIDVLGSIIGALPFVTHCYRRPRRLPHWPYNLFAMLHGSTREEVEAKRIVVAGILGDACRQNAILYSTKILKKTGMRIAA